MPKKAKLTHLDDRGGARMVDVGAKDVTERRAVATGFVRMEAATLDAISSGTSPKGDVLAIARIAGIQAAKRTPELIPLCHSVALTGCEVALEAEPAACGIRITATAKARDRTGVEMEALTAVSVAALTVYDMLKAIDRAMVIEEIALAEKEGGKSGSFRREAAHRRTTRRSIASSAPPTSRSKTKATR